MQQEQQGWRTPDKNNASFCFCQSFGLFPFALWNEKWWYDDYTIAQQWSKSKYKPKNNFNVHISLKKSLILWTKPWKGLMVQSTSIYSGYFRHQEPILTFRATNLSSF